MEVGETREAPLLLLLLPLLVLFVLVAPLELLLVLPLLLQGAALAPAVAVLAVPAVPAVLLLGPVLHPASALSGPFGLGTLSICLTDMEGGHRAGRGAHMDGESRVYTQSFFRSTASLAAFLSA